MLGWWRRWNTPSKRSIEFNRKYALNFAVVILTPGVAMLLWLDSLGFLSLAATAACGVWVVLAGWQSDFGSRGKWHSGVVVVYYVLGSSATVAYWIMLLGGWQASSTKQLLIMFLWTLIYAAVAYPTYLMLKYGNKTGRSRRS